MHTHRFYDKGLAHASYAIVSGDQMIVVDPGRDPQPYYDFARKEAARIVGVIETHPHADFVSSHVDIAEATGATIYNSRLTGADYEHTPFDEGDVIRLPTGTLHAINTPGHSPDSITVLLKDKKGNSVAAFTGDTLFVGDVGRPDLRESVGNMQAKREELAKQMYHSTRDKLMPLDADTKVYPAHGPGSLCGKGMSSELESTIGQELRTNRALQPMSEAEFVEMLLDGQPFIPKYFGYAVEQNKQGPAAYSPSLEAVDYAATDAPDGKTLVIDARPQADFKQAHYAGAINIQDGGKFETWLGSIVGPEEQFYLVAATDTALETIVKKAAKIGYEANIKAALIFDEKHADAYSQLLDVAHFKQSPEQYTIVDIRNNSEVEGNRIFEGAIHVPLPELRERTDEIPTDKPVVIHCAGGYRSAAGQSIVERSGSEAVVYDLSTAIAEFK